MPHLWQQNPRIFTFLLALLGGVSFHFFNIPLPFLFGSMAACLVAALIGLPLKGFGQVSVGARTILGVAAGASITPALFAEISTMALSLALVPIFIVIVGIFGVIFFRQICRFDTPTAYYAAMPGGLQDMLIFGEEAGGNIRILSLVHATRVLIIVSVAPIILVHFFGATLDNPIGLPSREIDPLQLFYMCLAAIVGWKLAEYIGMFGASILGPLILTAIFSLSGIVTVRPPEEAIIFAQFFIGSTIGVHYVGITFRELQKVVGLSSLYTLLLAMLAAGFSTVANQLELASEIEAFLAFLPGGQAEITVLSIVAGAELGYIITHHIARILLVIIGAPICARLRKTNL